MAIDNPFAMPNPFGDPFGVGETAPRQPGIPRLTPEEQDSLLSRIGSGALHGLGYIGGSLSKAFGGRAIRGLLGGRPEELASIIPFSDTLGITDPSNEVRGSDLLGGNQDTSLFSPEGIGGLGIDILTDPATYLTFGSGALTKLGQQASKLGVLPKSAAARITGLSHGMPGFDTFAEDIARNASLGKAAGPVAPKAMSAAESAISGKPLGGRVGLHVPFTDASTTFDLSGPLGMAGRAAGAIPGASWAAGKIGEATEPLRLGFNSMFRRSSKGQMDPILQDLAIKTSAEAPGAISESLRPMTGIIEDIQKLSGWQPGMEWTPELTKRADEIGRQVRMAAERLPDPAAQSTSTALATLPTGMSQVPTQLAGVPAVPSAQAVLAGLPPEILDLAQRTKSILRDSWQAHQEVGYTHEAIPGYFPRQASQLPLDKSGRRVYTDAAKPQDWMSRNKLFQGMYTEGPASINELSMNQGIHGMAPQDATDAILKNYLGWTPQMEQEFGALSAKQSAALGPAGEARMTELLRNFGNHTPQEMQELAGLMQQKAGHMAQPEIQRLDSLSGLRKQAGELAGWQKRLDIPALEQVGGFFGNHPASDMERYLIREAVAKQNAKAAYEAVERMAVPAGEPGARPVNDVLRELSLAPNDQFKDLFLPRARADALVGFVKPANAPEGAKPWLSVLDSITNLTKAGQTAWPATMMRNFMSDLFMRFSGGGSPIAPLVKAKSLMEGQTIPGIAGSIARFSGMTDAEATQQISRELYQLGLMDTKKYQAMEAAGVNPLLETTRREMPTIGVPQNGFGARMAEHMPGLEDLTNFTQGRLNPLNVRGVGGAEQSAFAPVGAAQTAQNYLEEMNRVATYLDAAERGFHPVAALEQAVNAHHDFGNLSRFERDVMRRVFPYYSWSRQNLPSVIGELATNPGGRMAQTMRVFNEAQGRSPGLFPPDLAQTGYAIPAGEADASGRRNYLTSTGLNFEDLSQLTGPSQIVGATNPLIRVPFEMATGRQVFTGRDVPTNYPIEGTPLANELLTASPLSRVFSTARQIGTGMTQGDVTPALTSLMGPRITQVDSQAARRNAIRQATEELLRGVPEVSSFQRLYVRPDQVPNLSPQELQMYQLYRLLEQQRQTPPSRPQPSRI